MLEHLHPEVRAQAWAKFRELKLRNPRMADADLWAVTLDVVRFNNRVDTALFAAAHGLGL